jgi:uncharacterized membrane protein
MFQEQFDKLIPRYLPIAIEVHHIKQFLNRLGGILLCIQKHFDFFNCYVTAVVDIEV